MNERVEGLYVCVTGAEPVFESMERETKLSVAFTVLQLSIANLLTWWATPDIKS